MCVKSTRERVVEKSLYGRKAEKRCFLLFSRNSESSKNYRLKKGKESGSQLSLRVKKAKQAEKNELLKEEKERNKEDNI